jgi:hypothetical protein
MDLEYTHALAAGVALSLLAAADVSATANGAAHAITPPARGTAAVVLNVGTASAGTLPTLDFKLQTSDDGSTSWVDIASTVAAQSTAANAQILAFRPGEQKKYIRHVVTIGGTSSPSFPVSATLVYFGA